MLRYFHIVIPEVRTAEGKLHLIHGDRPDQQVRLHPAHDRGERGDSLSFLVALSEAVPYKIHTVLTDNDILFTFPPRYADGPTATYMSHMFDMRCERKQDRAPAHQDQASLDQWACRTDEGGHRQTVPL